MKKNLEKSSVKSAAKRKNETWTFQVDPDVREAFKELFGEDWKKKDRGFLSRTINSALMLKSDVAAAALVLAEQELAAQQAKVDALSQKLTSLLAEEAKPLTSTLSRAASGTASGSQKHKSEGPLL